MQADSPDPPRVPPTRTQVFLRNLAQGFRAAFFLRIDPALVQADAGHFIALVCLSVVVDFISAFAVTGPGGVLNVRALPTEVLWVPLALFAGYLGARVSRDDRQAMAIPVVVATAGIAFSILSTIAALAVMRWPNAVTLSVEIYQLMFAWWAGATWLAVRRLGVPAPRPIIQPAWIVALVVFVPAWLLPPDQIWGPAEFGDEGESSTFSEEALYAQPELLRKAEAKLKPQRPGVEDLYFVAFAPFARQDVFMKEVQTIERLMEQRFDTVGRSIALISHPTLVARYPIATLSSLRHALRAIGNRIDPDEDVVMLHLTSHGSPTQELAVDFPPLDLQSIRPRDLRAALDDAGIKWRIVVVSACYSGGFVDGLKDDRTMVVTAADARHMSFGCGNAYDFTYFSQAFYDEAMRKTRNLEEAFALAKASVRSREQKEGLEPSNPQAFVGAAMKTKLVRLENHWKDAGHAR